jgi:hypothetical protein
MRARLSAENRIANQLAILGCPAKFACAVAGVSASRLSQAFAGDFDLGVREAQDLETTLAKIAAVVRAFEPVRIDLRDARAMRDLLKTMELNDISPTEIGYAIRGIFEKHQ